MVGEKEEKKKKMVLQRTSFEERKNKIRRKRVSAW